MVTALAVPRHIVSFLGGYAFGLGLGTALALAATELGCVLSFFYARLIGRPLVAKRLVLDFETLEDELGGIANLEGLTFGPRLANGHASLVVVADDNFPTADSPTDRNQILVFEIMP